MICGQAGIAGSATLGDYVTLGGRVAIRDHVSIASKVRLAANSSVTKDIQKPGDYGGFPAVSLSFYSYDITCLTFSFTHKCLLCPLNLGPYK
jgi:UDP-3-O-[3-hydroxymyristoyl] glucosamine N-acyltransferase